MFKNKNLIYVIFLIAILILLVLYYMKNKSVENFSTKCNKLCTKLKNKNDNEKKKCYQCRIDKNQEKINELENNNTDNTVTGDMDNNTNDTDDMDDMVETNNMVETNDMVETNYFDDIGTDGSDTNNEETYLSGIESYKNFSLF
jgi:hypothetical protein